MWLIIIIMEYYVTIQTFFLEKIANFERWYFGLCWNQMLNPSLDANQWCNIWNLKKNHCLNICKLWALVINVSKKLKKWTNVQHTIVDHFFSNFRVHWLERLNHYNLTSSFYKVKILKASVKFQELHIQYIARGVEPQFQREFAYV